MGAYKVPDRLNHRVLGHWPGEEFDADIPAAQEARLIARGQLEVRTSGLAAKSRDDLDVMARELNIDPAAHPNKPSLIDAIKAETKE